MAALVVGPFRSFSQFPLLFAFFVPFRNLGRPPGVYPYSDAEPGVYPPSDGLPKLRKGTKKTKRNEKDEKDRISRK